MIDIVLSDLDSTVADVSAREPLAYTGKRKAKHSDWVAYSKACLTDKPVAGAVRTLQLLSRNYPIFLVSGRNVEALEETHEWLLTNNVPYASVRLRKEDDISHNGLYKVAYIEFLRENGYNPVLMLEDHVGVGLMVEEAGVPVLSVQPRYTDNIGVNFNNLTEESGVV